MLKQKQQDSKELNEMRFKQDRDNNLVSELNDENA